MPELSPALLAALERGAALLTTDRRAARDVRRAFRRYRNATQLRGLQLAEVLPLDAWLAACWHRLLVCGCADRVLLNSSQEHSLWRAIISADASLGAGGRQPTRAIALAELAAEAWQRLCLAEGQRRLNECGATSEGQAFLRWSREFERRAARGRWLTGAQLPEALGLAVAKHGSAAVALPAAGLVLVEFPTHVPAHARLLDILRHTGCPVSELPMAAHARRAHGHRAEDESTELADCAAWVRRWREQKPEARIAVVVPGMEERREAIRRVFSSALEVAPFDPEPPFEFSLGHPLAHETLIQTALALLRWTAGSLTFSAVRSLLLSPWCGSVVTPGASATATLAAAEFDAFELTEFATLRPELSLAEMIATLEGSKLRPRLADLLFRLRQLRQTASKLGFDLPGAAPASYATIAEGFRILLEAAGCAPGPSAGAAEFQLWNTFESLLDEIATLDLTAPPASPQTVLAELSRLAQTRLFAPETREAPVQILVPLELGATRFDALWFLGADDLTWPPGTATSPLLPWRLQFALGLPGADRARDRAVFAQLTERIASTAGEVVFSYAATANDGERRPSPLLANLGLAPLAARPPAPMRAPLPRHTIIDDSVLPPPIAAHGLPGGARILELQAACSFRAFAELRAFSSATGTRELGFDARERGTLVHRTLELFWRRVHDQRVLNSMTLDERHQTLDECILEALARPRSTAQTTWDHAYLATQRQRLHDLLPPWLDLEAARPYFAVLQQETALDQAEIGGLRIRRLRVDRIDETEGGLLILDYKTGAANPNGWRTDRLEAPQLPLYAAIFSAAAQDSDAQPALFPNDQLAGVAFARLRAGQELDLRGFADDPRVLGHRSPMDAPSFPEQVAEWQRILSALAAAFVAGEARVEPRAYPRTCQHCGQRVLCRLNPATLGSSDVDDEIDYAAAGALEGEESFG